MLILYSMNIKFQGLYTTYIWKLWKHLGSIVMLSRSWMLKVETVCVQVIKVRKRNHTNRLLRISDLGTWFPSPPSRICNTKFLCRCFKTRRQVTEILRSKPPPLALSGVNVLKDGSLMVMRSRTEFNLKLSQINDAMYCLLESLHP
jgi:hypothetical protein